MTLPSTNPASEPTTSVFCHIVGTVGRAIQGGTPTKQFAHVDLEDITLDSGVSSKMHRTVDGNTVITSPYVLSLSIARNQAPPVQCLLGPTFTSGNAAKGKPAYIDVPAQDRIVPMPGFYLMNGWLFLTGPQPVAKTEFVAAGAEGCELVIEIRGSITRVYFLESGTANVHGWYRIVNSPDPPVNVAYPNRYVEIETIPTPTVKGIYTYDPHDPCLCDPHPFLCELRQIQACAGLPFCAP